jgi:hypothetical protein
MNPEKFFSDLYKIQNSEQYSDEAAEILEDAEDKPYFVKNKILNTAAKIGGIGFLLLSVGFSGSAAFVNFGKIGFCFVLFVVLLFEAVKYVFSFRLQEEKERSGKYNFRLIIALLCCIAFEVAFHVSLVYWFSVNNQKTEAMAAAENYERASASILQADSTIQAEITSINAARAANGGKYKDWRDGNRITELTKQAAELRKNRGEKVGAYQDLVLQATGVDTHGLLKKIVWFFALFVSGGLIGTRMYNAHYLMKSAGDIRGRSIVPAEVTGPAKNRAGEEIESAGDPFIFAGGRPLAKIKRPRKGEQYHTAEELRQLAAEYNSKTQTAGNMEKSAYYETMANRLENWTASKPSGL